MHLAKVLRILVWLCVAHQALAVAKGLNSTRLPNECNPKCSWTNPLIWDNGVVPAETDTVDIQIAGTYTIIIDNNITIADFEIGFKDDKNGAQTFLVTNGSTFASKGGFKSYLSVQVQVDANSSMVISLAGEINGHFVLYGTASFLGTSSDGSLYINSANIQISFSYVTGQLELANGNLTVSNKLTVTTTSSVIGNGYIFGSVNMNGNLKPGNSANSIGTIRITGDLTLSSLSDVYIEIASDNNFDRVIIGGTLYEDGIATLSPQGSYEPLAHQQFIALNHTAQRNGFKSVRGSGFLGLLENKWQAVVDQSYTAFLYDDASSVLISFALIASCAMFLVL